MPLLHEIFNPETGSILCFVPNGHLTANGFADFPGIEDGSETCWYYANRRLLSLRHTQTPIDDSEYGFVAQELVTIKNEQSAISESLYQCKSIFFSWLNNRRNVIDEAGLQRLLVTILDLVDNNPSALGTSDDSQQFLTLIQNHREIFVRFFNSIGKIMLKNKQQTGLNTEEGFNKFFFKASQLYKTLEGAKISKERLNSASVMEHLASKGLRPGPNQTIMNLDGWRTQHIAYNMNLAIVPVTEDAKKNLQAWRNLVNVVLSKLGPFVTAGFVGIPFYHGSKPKPRGKLGSVELLGFEPNDYSYESMLTAHCVTVIGMHADKIIYLDPIHGSKLDGARQAYVMNIDKFYERIELAQQSLYRQNKVLLATLKDDEIDTTMELMLEHTNAVTKSKPRLVNS